MAAIFRYRFVVGTILVSKLNQFVITNIRGFHKADFVEAIVMNTREIPENTENVFFVDYWPLHEIMGLQVNQLFHTVGV